MLGGSAGQTDSLPPLMQSSDSLWPEGRKVRAIKKIQTVGHMYSQNRAAGRNDSLVQVRSF